MWPITGIFLQRIMLNLGLHRLQNPTIEALERLRSPAPRISLDCQPPCRLADARRELGIAKQAVHRLRECLRLVLDEEVSPGDSFDSPAPSVVDTMAFPMAMASTILRRVPPPSRNGTTTAAAAARCGRKSGTKPVSSTRGPASRWSDREGLPPMTLRRASGCASATRGQIFREEIDHAVDIGGVGEVPENDHGATVRRRVGGARLVVLDVRRVGNDGGSDPGDYVEQAPFVFRAAKVDPIRIAVGPQLFPPQLAPIGRGVKAAGHAFSSAGILPGSS